MKVVVPIEINQSNIVDSSVPEPDVTQGEQEWKPNKPDRVAVGTDEDVNSMTYVRAISGSNVTLYKEWFATFDGAHTVKEFNIFYSPTGVFAQYDVSGLTNPRHLLLYERITTSGAYRIELTFTSTSPTGTNFTRVYTQKIIFYYSGSGQFQYSTVEARQERALLQGDVNPDEAYTYLGAYCTWWSPAGNYSLYILAKGAQSEANYHVYYGNINSSSPIGSFSFLTSEISLANYASMAVNNSYQVTVVNKSNIAATFNLQGTLIGEPTIGGLEPKAIGYIPPNTYGALAFYEIYTDGYYYEYNANFESSAFYSIGEMVIDTTTHKRYVAAVSAPVNPPAVGVNTVPPEWTDIGYTNKYRAFDGVISNQVVAQDEITYVISSVNTISSVSGFNLTNIGEVNIKQKDSGGNVVYENDIQMRDNSSVVDWYAYYFSPIIETNNFIVTDLYAYGNSTVEITASGEGEVGIGEIVVGSAADLGVTQYGSSLQLQDFSKKQRDEFGNFEIIRRGTSKLVNYDVKIDRGRIAYVFKILSDLTTTPCVWVGGETFSDETTVYGYYKDSTINIDAPSVCSATISVEGLV